MSIEELGETTGCEQAALDFPVLTEEMAETPYRTIREMGHAYAHEYYGLTGKDAHRFAQAWAQSYQGHTLIYVQNQGGEIKGEKYVD